VHVLSLAGCLPCGIRRTGKVFRLQIQKWTFGCCALVVLLVLKNPSCESFQEARGRHKAGRTMLMLRGTGSVPAPPNLRVHRKDVKNTNLWANNEDELMSRFVVRHRSYRIQSSQCILV
jgi:hypothetical protein